MLEHKIGFLSRKEILEFNKLQTLRRKRLFWGLSFFSLLFFSQVFKGFYLELIGIILFLPLFIGSIVGSRRQSLFLASLIQLKSFYLRQSSFLNSSFESSTSAEQMSDPDLARDLDLNLLFDQLNLCFSKQGEEQLNRWLCQDFAQSNLQQRQSRLKELIPLSGPIRRLQILSQKQKVDLSQLDLELSRPFIDPRLKWSWLIPISWGILMALVIIGAPVNLLKIVFFIFIATSLYYLNHTQYMLSRLESLSLQMGELNKKMGWLEKISLRLSYAPSLKQKTASKDLKKMNRLIAFIGVRTNPILFYVLNTLLPWDFLFSRLCERSRARFYQDFKLWAQEAIEIDTFLSLINLHTYRKTVWPEMDQKSFVSCIELAHPLIPEDKIVTNDFNPENFQAMIITGSNMSGKSTFLRAVGINFCLAQIGAPVFAKSFHFSPMKIISCIRVSDSLRDGKSYFFAEVQRMKKILKSAELEKVFFLIDEPLRGTNNQERLIGNQRYLKKLLQSQGQGFICTHDLELTKMTENNPTVINYHFSDEWIKDDLHFDYKIKKGPSTTTNALKILDKEGLL